MLIDFFYALRSAKLPVSVKEFLVLLEAMQAGVPIVSNPPLARALFRLDLDTEIPPEHYQAVAEIIAYVWRLGGQGQTV